MVDGAAVRVRGAVQLRPVGLASALAGVAGCDMGQRGVGRGGGVRCPTRSGGGAGARCRRAVAARLGWRPRWRVWLGAIWADAEWGGGGGVRCRRAVAAGWVGIRVGGCGWERYGPTRNGELPRSQAVPLRLAGAPPSRPANEACCEQDQPQQPTRPGRRSAGPGRAACGRALGVADAGWREGDAGLSVSRQCGRRARPGAGGLATK